MNFQTIPVRCCTCYRVRLDDVWQDRPGKLPNEVTGECATCLDFRRKRAAAERVRIERRTERKAAAGFGPAAEGQDVFKGMR